MCECAAYVHSHFFCNHFFPSDHESKHNSTCVSYRTHLNALRRKPTSANLYAMGTDIGRRRQWWRAPALCDRMAATDARIRVIHQVNAGLSAARNAGLKVAQGKYVWFVDSDDYVATDTLAAAVNAMETSAVELSFVEFPVAVKWGHPTQHTVALVAETYTDKWNGGLAQRVTSTVMPIINYIDVKQLIIFVLRRESLKMLSLYCPY